MPFALRRGPAPALGLDRASYRPGDPVHVTVTVPDCAEPPRGHVRLRCHLPREPDGGMRLTAIVHIPPDARPTCQGAQEVAAWEVVAVVQRRAASAWVEVLPFGC